MNRIHDIYRPVAERKRDFREVERILTQDEVREQTERCQKCGIPFCHGAACLPIMISSLRIRSISARFGPRGRYRSRTERFPRSCIFED